VKKREVIAPKAINVNENPRGGELSFAQKRIPLLEAQYVKRRDRWGREENDKNINCDGLGGGKRGKFPFHVSIRD